jgi:hypothetical protein
LPKHRLLKDELVDPEIAEKLTHSLVLMHGGMASNVGPILEMVSEKYLLRGEKNGMPANKPTRYLIIFCRL